MPDGDVFFIPSSVKVVKTMKEAIDLSKQPAAAMAPKPAGEPGEGDDEDADE